MLEEEEEEEADGRAEFSTLKIWFLEDTEVVENQGGKGWGEKARSCDTCWGRYVYDGGWSGSRGIEGGIELDREGQCEVI